jgi:hypothetical protein
MFIAVGRGRFAQLRQRVIRNVCLTPIGDSQCRDEGPQRAESSPP